MKYSLLLLLFTALAISCGDNESQCPKGTIDDSKYDSISNTDFKIESVEGLDGDCISVNVSYGGGCKMVTADLVARSAVTRSIPPQRLVKLDLHDDDSCKALVFEKYKFDISDMRVDGTDEVILIFSEDIRYSYKY